MNLHLACRRTGPRWRYIRPTPSRAILTTPRGGLQIGAADPDPAWAMGGFWTCPGQVVHGGPCVGRQRGATAPIIYACPR